MGPISLLGLAASALLVTAPATEVDDLTECITVDALQREVDALLPNGPGPDSPLAVSVQVTAVAGEAGMQRRVIRLVLSDRRKTEPLLERELRLLEVDCPDAPALLARILVRRFQALPRDAWQPWKPPTPKPVAKPYGGFELDLEAGLDRPELRGALVGQLQWPVVDRLALSLGLSASLSWPVRVGEGHARMVAVGVEAGVLWRQPLGGGFGIGPAISLLTGLQVAQGFAFDQSETALFPRLDVAASVTLWTPAWLHLRVGIAAPLLGVRLYQAGQAPPHYRDPAWRFFAGLGFTFEG